MMKNKHLVSAFLMLVCSIVITQTAIAQPEKATAAVESIMQQQKVVGLSVAVVKNGKLIYTHAFGNKNLADNTPLTTTDIFRIASISKSFSATAIMQLAEAGKLNLDDDFSQLVGFKVRNPAFPETVITLRHVLSHQSSINDSEGYFTLDAIQQDKNANWAKCYNNYEPGKGYMYCNLNYNMVGAVIEKITGERFDQYIRHHILDPLNVYGGYAVDSLNKQRFATIYEYNKDSAQFIESPAAYNPRSAEIANHILGYTTPIFSPTGGMKISAPDLATYMMMHMNMGKLHGKRIISKKSAVAMQTPFSNQSNYGFALLKTDKLISGKTMTGHTGSAYGLYSMMFFEPKEKFGIVVISNGCDPKYAEGFNAVLLETVRALYSTLID